MSNLVKCPKCKSEQITAQKRGFSAGKAVAGAVVTGGIGVLAGLHGSGTVEVHCLKCGHSWNPKKLAETQKQEQLQKALEAEKRWKAKFYSAYDHKDFELAESVLNKNFSSLLKTKTLEQSYHHLKSGDTQMIVVQLVLWGTLAGIIIWFTSCIT